MNPSVPQSVIDNAMEADSASAAAEYGAEFRTDVETFIAREVVDAAVILGRHELPRIDGVQYVAHIDPSGGSSDSMTLGICHMEGDVSSSRAVLDLVRERKPPFSPDDVAKEFSTIIKSYGIASARSDRYAGLWPRERFAVHGVDVQSATLTTSDMYLALLPILNSGRCDLLDHPRLISQLTALERRTGRGKDVIDHPPGQHDDIITAAAGAIVAASQRQAQQVPIVSPIYVGTPRNIPGGTTGGSAGFSPYAEPGERHVANVPNDNSRPPAAAPPDRELPSTDLYYQWMANGGGSKWGPF
jgi:hypothetical protein